MCKCGHLQEKSNESKGNVYVSSAYVCVCAYVCETAKTSCIYQSVCLYASLSLPLQTESETSKLQATCVS